MEAGSAAVAAKTCATRGCVAWTFARAAYDRDSEELEAALGALRALRGGFSPNEALGRAERPLVCCVRARWNPTEWLNFFRLHVKA